MVTTTHSETMTAANALAAYGKSFHWARRFLGQHMGMKAERLYQFCRVLDDMADGDIEHGPKRLGRIRKDILTAGTASDPLLSHFQPFLSKQKFSTKVIVALAKTPDDIAALPVKNAVSRLLALADDYYKSGIAGLSYLPLRAHISIAVAALVYRQIGVQLAQQN